MFDGEDLLVETIIQALQHGVVLGIRGVHREVFLDATDSLQGHVLGDFHRIGAPGSHHFTTRAYEIPTQLLIIHQLGIAVKPSKFAYFIFGKFVIRLRGDHTFRPCPEKKNHNLSRKISIIMVQR